MKDNPFKKTKKEAIEAMWDKYFEEKYPGYLERKAKRNQTEHDRFVAALNPEPEPEPEPPPSLIGRFRAFAMINSPEDVIELHRSSISRFDHQGVCDDIRSYGQTEFERGIEFAMEYFRLNHKNLYLSSPEISSPEK